MDDVRLCETLFFSLIFRRALNFTHCYELKREEKTNATLNDSTRLSDGDRHGGRGRLRSGLGPCHDYKLWRSPSTLTGILDRMNSRAIRLFKQSSSGF